MDLQQVLRMNSGVGESSYANNSRIQGVIISRTKALRQDAAVKAYLGTDSPGTVSIADIGCASGPTALLVVADVIEAIERRCAQLQRRPPDFALLLNDLYSNDFNTVFRSLPEFYWQRSGTSSGRCFVSGVPGSFYGRLFPGRSLHFVHSSSSLHWLSEIPEELQSGSPGLCLNKGKVYLSRTSPSWILDAYLKQFQRDFRLFLASRAEEIVAGGHMVLTLMGTRSSDPTMQEDCYMWELLADALNSMASEELVEEERIDSFNAPYYAPSMEELKREVEGEGSFTITSSEHFEASWDAVDDLQHCTGVAAARGSHQHYYKAIRENGNVNGGSWPQSYARLMAKGVRAVLESMLRSHFGEGILDELFSRYGDLLEKYYAANKAEVTNVVIALVRN